MDRRAYERMEQGVRAIHRALTGEEPHLDGVADLHADAEPATAAAPAHDEVERRFTELVLEARTLPGFAERLSALEPAPAIDGVEHAGTAQAEE